MTGLRRVLAVAAKDLRIELRTGRQLFALLAYALLLLVVLSLALDPAENELRPVFGGLLWVAYAFAGLMAVGGSFASESADGALDILLLAPADRSYVYYGKCLSNGILLLAVEAVLTPVYAVLFHVTPPQPLLLAGPLVMGTAGFVAAGTLLAALTVRSGGGAFLLPLTLFPLLAPALLAAVEWTDAVVTGEPARGGPWFHLLVVYDVLFLLLPGLLFEYLFEG